MQENKTVRYPAVAGMFYSANEKELRRDLDSYLADSDEIEGVDKIIGLVAPHAGYMYSGAVAAQAYRQLKGRSFDTVVVISPSHRTPFKNISAYPGEFYGTPLGDIEVDMQTVRELAEADRRIILSDVGHDVAEHALEVQLPFLQSVLDEFKLVPLVMGDQSRENVDALASVLHKVFANDSVLLVASSDLSHFHNGSMAREMDGLVVDDIGNFDEQALKQKIADGKIEMCGGGPVLSVMQASRLMGANKSKVLQYKNSGDVTGDYSQVVGYLSAIFYS